MLVRAERRWRLPDLAAVWQYRELFWVMALRDIRVRYKQTVLGVAWAIVQPLGTMIVFTTISRFARIATDGVRPEVFYYCGLLRLAAVREFDDQRGQQPARQPAPDHEGVFSARSSSRSRRW